MKTLLPRGPTLFLAAVIVSIGVAGHVRAAQVVSGTSDPWLAGMPDGSTASGPDSAPNQSPSLVTGQTIAPGMQLMFSATGLVANAAGYALVGPDGGSFTFHQDGGQNGISDVNAPFNALLGVFLDATQPSLSALPATLDFSAGGNVAGGINYTSLAPDLRQVFFIGDGLTATSVQQIVVVPSGATRLFLGTMDSFEWINNVGSFTVAVQAVPEPGALSMAALAAVLAGGWGVVRRGRDCRPSLHSIGGGMTLDIGWFRESDISCGWIPGGQCAEVWIGFRFGPYVKCRVTGFPVLRWASANFPARLCSNLRLFPSFFLNCLSAFAAR